MFKLCNVIRPYGNYDVGDKLYTGGRMMISVVVLPSCFFECVVFEFC